MNTWIALLRGINVGGHNKLPMKDLVRALEQLGLADVRTYIQSGNVVFRSDESDPAALSARIQDTIEAGHDFRPRVLILTLETLRAALEACPFPTGETEAKTVHFAFLAAPATQPDLAALDAVKTADEEYTLAPGVLFLHAPSGIGRSRLAERVERALGVPTTGRNLRTLTNVIRIAEEVATR